MTPRQAILALLGLLAATLGPAAAQPGDAPGQQYQADLQALMSNPHRLAGLEDGSLAAGAYVKRRLAEIARRDGAPMEIFTQTFPVVQPIQDTCTITVGGVTEPMLAVRPNGIQASITPPEGITGQCLFAGSGSPQEYGPVDPEGRIVVLDFDCLKQWRHAFAFGARAVVFVEPKNPNTPAARAWQHVNVPANLPRFYVTHAQARRLGLLDRDNPPTATLRSSMHWQKLYAENVIAVIRGTEPAFNRDADNPKRQMIILATGLDSYSEVPMVSPGARDAANVAALLQMAETFQANPPRRDIVLCFFDADRLNHTGARIFYGNLYRRRNRRKLTPLSLDEQAEQIAEELRLVKAAGGLLASGDPLNKTVAFETARSLLASGDLSSHDAPEAFVEEVRDYLRKKSLRDQIRRVATEVMTDLRRARLRRRNLLQQIKPDADITLAQRVQLEAQLADLQPRLDELTIRDRILNSLERVLHEGQSILPGPGVSPAQARQNIEKLYESISDANRRAELIERTPETFRQRIAETMALTDLHLRELEYNRLLNQQSQAILDAIGPDRSRLVLHLSMALGDARRRWTFIHGKHINTKHATRIGDYNSILRTILALQKASPLEHFDPLPISQTLTNSAFSPAQYSDSSAIAKIFAFYNMSLMTVMDPLVRQGQPADRLEAIDAQVILDQALEAADMIARLADSPEMNLTHPRTPLLYFHETQWNNNKPSGASVRRYGAGLARADLPVPGALVAIYPAFRGVWQNAAVTNTPPGMVPALLVQTQANGYFDMPPISGWDYRRTAFPAALYDNSPDFRNGADRPTGQGIIQAMTSARTFSTTYGGRNHHVVLFESQMMTAMGYGFYREGSATQVLRALSTSPFRNNNHLRIEDDNVLSLFLTTSARGVKLFNPKGMVLLNNSPDREDYMGRGLPIDSFRFPPTAPQTAHDLISLNEYRLDLLRANRISQESLTTINGRARDQYQDAEEMGVSQGLDAYMGEMAASAALARRAYPPTVDVVNDLVTAVVLLLLLAIPFAFALERLIIGTPHIFRQIGWFIGFFLLTFVILYLVNPAFQIAATPIIIFLAFMIILLAGLVVFVLVRKLQNEIRKMQGLATTVHSMDLSRLSTMMAAVNMGISTMRRRALRTILTAVTIILLTFTILTFASFGQEWAVSQTYQGTLSGPERILVHHPYWSLINEGECNMLRGSLSGRATVVPRWWVAPTAAEAESAMTLELDLDFLASTEDASRVVPLATAIGLDTRDLQAQPGMKGLLDGQLDLLDTDGVFLTDAMAETLGLAPADIGQARVLVKGQTLTYAGRITPELARWRQMEDSHIVPINYAASSGSPTSVEESIDDSNQNEAPDLENPRFVEFPLDMVCVVSPSRAELMGGTIRSITIYPHQPGQSESIGRTVAETMLLPTYAGYQGGVYRMMFRTIAQASGWKDLLIPIILGGLIVFATMLGSVSDREKEIYTFSSLGLAPVHVGGLFFAEAGVYAVVGGMGGYLLGQVVARLMAWLGSMGLLDVPAMNYSSTNAVVTILIVMGTVMISTLWPAIKASRSANPGIQRRWKIPQPEGDLYDLVFPFTVSTYDITGMVSFLKEHFDNFSDAAVGEFANLGNEIFLQKDNEMLAFRAEVALAPMDLGVTQNFSMLAQPSDIEGIDEVRIVIRRLSGTRGDWRRSNRLFINGLRKQFLIWRSLPPEVMDTYRQRTFDAWESFPTKTSDPHPTPRLQEQAHG